MAAAKVQSFHDFVLFPHQDRSMASMTNNPYSISEYPGIPAHYPPYSEEDTELIYNTAPLISTAAYTESTSGASAQSAASSAVGSPYSQPCHNMSGSQDRWMDLGLGIAGGLAPADNFLGSSYPISENTYGDSHSGTYVDPSLVSYDQAGPITIADSPYNFPPPPLPSFPSHFPGSPSLSELSSHESHRSVLKSRHQSPHLFHPYPAQRRRRDSYTSHRSPYPHESPRSRSIHSEEEGRDSRRCPHPDCGRLVKDIKAHMLTHQAERPEKCPIVDCEYHIKGFARKYDRCRHTLTHFKGTMVCNFCPNSGSSLEKSFNRADVFKRHLTSVHGVEQCPPNSRKKSPSARKALSNEDKVAGCSTCSATFRNAQEFYDHLDDCVLKYLDKGEASEGINEHHLKKINNDKAVKETMERNSLPLEITNAQAMPRQHYDEEEDGEDDEEAEWSGSYPARPSLTKLSAGVQRLQTGTGLTHSAGGIKLAGKGRRGKKGYPASWGSPADKMAMKKRVLVVYDGDRRLWKDEIMVDNEYEVRNVLAGDEKRYYTDFDKATMKRAQALHGATEAERGPFMPRSEEGKLMI
ncbi:MAG: hypothetical protein GOMPHAMPRED_005967 [Gomphillus americanus]|uniref:C2H2-type domain-containing protein n=1 Tax=Gomphillus americanus TaxID=1940652 RepID=A0A8H3FX04_9LECA|nr:MAG: hypothetical protein GOMPHAMPRED_005967 [Gomphillus americanus]